MACRKKFGITGLLFLSGILSFNTGLAQNRTLGFFLQQAKENSPVIKEHQNQVLAYRLDSVILKASLKTRAEIISSNSFAPVVNGYGYDEAITNITTLSELIRLSRNFISRGNKAAHSFKSL